ncbi:LysE family translocator [Methylophaga marina]|uniref:LysE family translocator n=3 Tax=Piscirickettsiaceae TaxID=135616 RepID=A0ABN0TH47_9GAMM|tara:strand:+ start:33103 stop:33732 length:630 start_codon:yes stop_codon:yes gene_type:complete
MTLMSDNLMMFIVTSIVLALAPGPDNLYVISQSALYGARTGLIITLGLCSGLIIHIAAVVFGLATWLITSPMTFVWLKIIGAGYLLYLAWRAFRTPVITALTDTKRLDTSLSLLRIGFLMNVSNPKVALFFLAFLPQFIDTSGVSVSWQIVYLGLIFMLTALMIFSVMALTAASMGRWLIASSRAQRILQSLTALIFTLLAARLLFYQL